MAINIRSVIIINNNRYYPYAVVFIIFKSFYNLFIDLFTTLSRYFSR